MRRMMYVAVGVRRKVGLTRAQANRHFLFTGLIRYPSLPPYFCVSTVNKGLTGEWLVSRTKGLSREWPATCEPSSVQWYGNPAVLVTVLDSFNDLLLQRLSVRHKLLRSAFRTAAGRNRIPDYGVWLTHSTFRSVLPKVAPIFKTVHDLRVRAELAHATQKKTGRFTRPVSYREKARLLQKLRAAYVELLSALAAI